VLVADDPAEHREFLVAFTGAEKVEATADGFRIALPRGAIDMLAPSAFTRRFDLAAPDTARGARLAALRFSGTAVAPARQTARRGAGYIERS